MKQEARRTILRTTIPALLFLSSVADAFGSTPNHQQSRSSLSLYSYLKKGESLFASLPGATALQPLLTDSCVSDCRVDWHVYVDQSPASLERGASATLDAFLGLAPDTVQIHPAMLPQTKKNKGPVVRCISTATTTENDVPNIEVTNVDSVDKVYRILTRHMRVPNVKSTTLECLKWKYKGNGYLESGEVSLAIDSYDKALASISPATLKRDAQEGSVLLMRSSAYLRRALEHKTELQRMVKQDLTEAVPDGMMESLAVLFEQAATHPGLAPNVFDRILTDVKYQDSIYRKTKFRHGLYQYALLHAAQDALRATELLPFTSKSWLVAGQTLSELWKPDEAVRYYERAMEVDNDLKETVLPIIKRLLKRKEILNSARGYGWSEDTWRLALDVAG